MALTFVGAASACAELCGERPAFLSLTYKICGMVPVPLLPETSRMIRKVKGGYKVLSEKGKNLGGPYKTKAEAEKRLRQVEFFKRKK